jgi:hypothetical protein
MGQPRLLLVCMLMASGALPAMGQPAESAAAAVPVDIRDIRGPVPVAVSTPFVVTGGLLLALAGGVLLLRREARRTASRLPPSPGETGQGPLDLLDRLAAEYRQGARPGDQLLIHLDGLIRATLAASTGLPAQRLTSAELLGQAEATVFRDMGARALLSDLLPLLDRVKFAGHQPGAADVDGALKAARALIEGSLASRAS